MDGSFLLSPVTQSSNTVIAVLYDSKMVFSTFRYKTQPAEVSDESAEIRQKKKYVGRHLTQPVTPDEKKIAEIATDMPEIQKTGSIHDR